MAETTITPLTNAQDSIERIGREISARSSDASTALKGALLWGWHAVALLAYVRLQPHREEFDAWVQDYLEPGEPGLNAERDARWENRQRLSSLELIDLLSEVDLPILKPEFYQGWQDRTSRCQTLRRKVAAVIRTSLNAGQREKLLLLLAGYHRLTRLPAGVRLDPSAVWQSFPALLDLLEILIDKSTQDSSLLFTGVEKCRSALKNA
jgi:hypothetical protein